MATATPESNVDAVRSADIFAQGMVDMLLPIVQDTDARYEMYHRWSCWLLCHCHLIGWLAGWRSVQSVFDAQAELQQKIQALGNGMATNDRHTERARQNRLIERSMS
jgi:hypothetical protein